MSEFVDPREADTDGQIYGAWVWLEAEIDRLEQAGMSDISTDVAGDAWRSGGGRPGALWSAIAGGVHAGLYMCWPETRRLGRHVMLRRLERSADASSAPSLSADLAERMAQW